MLLLLFGWNLARLKTKWARFTLYLILRSNTMPLFFFFFSFFLFYPKSPKCHLKWASNLDTTPTYRIDWRCMTKTKWTIFLIFPMRVRPPFTSPCPKPHWNKQLYLTNLILPQFRVTLGLMKSKIQFWISATFWWQNLFKQLDKTLVLTKIQGRNNSNACSYI